MFVNRSVSSCPRVLINIEVLPVEDMCGEREKETDRQTDKERERERDRQTDIQREIDRDREREGVGRERGKG